MPPAARPKPSRAAGCAMWGLIAFFVIAVGGYFLIGWQFSIGGEMPELRRPMAVLRGDVVLDRSSPSARIEADLRLDDGAVAAMREGDGLVHFELDLEAQPDVETLMVGVGWSSRAEVMRRIQPLPLDEDLRWTLQCEDASSCARTIGIDIELPDRGGATEVSWRLVATVRPPREASVPEVTIVELVLAGVSE